MQPLNVNISLYFGNLSSPCPLHEQAKDEIIFLGTAQCNYMVPNSLIIRRKHFAGNFNTCVLSL